MIFPILHNSENRDSYWIFIACVSWSIQEVVKFGFGVIKDLGMFKNAIVLIIATLKYNLFIILYPLGVFAELKCCYKAWVTLRNKDCQDREFSIPLPNALNVGFHFDLFIMIAVPILYVIFMPNMYISMFLQRKSYYSGFRRAIEQIAKNH